MKPIPSPTGLITFDAVARHLSFSRAGRELYITQGAVSHRIRALEEELDVVLFTRTSRKVALTEAGHVLFHATREALARLRAGLAELDSLNAPSRVSVSCSPSFAIRWLVPHLGDFRAAVPDVELHICAEDELREPGSETIDVCIRFGPGGYRGVEAEQLTREKVTPVCSPLYLERHTLERPEDLERCLLLHDDVLADHAGHVGWAEWLAASGADVSGDRGLHFSHSHMALDAAIAAQGVALARRSLVRTALRQRQLVAPFELSLESGLNYWLITRRSAPSSRPVADFRAWLLATLGEESPT